MASQANWPGKDIEDLIELYHNEEDLWNITRGSYLKKDCRMRALGRISKFMENKYTADAINKKLIQLRSYYGRELSKVRKSQKLGVSKGDIYKSKWPYFTLLDQFLCEQITPRGSVSNIDSQCEEEEEVRCTEEEEEEVEEENVESTNDDLHRIQMQCCPPVTKKRKLSEPNVLSEAVAVLSQLRAQLSPPSANTEEDEDFIFARYIAMEVRKVHDLSMKNNLKLSIQKQIFDVQKVDQLLRQQSL